jgi:thioesterase domain-containing protein
MLVLLDTVAKPERAKVDTLSEQARSIKILEDTARSLGITDEIIDMNNDRFITRLIHKMSEHRLMPESTPIETFKRTITQMLRATTLTANHRIQPCHAPIVFIRAAQQPQPEDPSIFDWSAHTSEAVTQLSVNALHSAMWETQHSREIAEIIIPQLLSVQSESGDAFKMTGVKA